MTDSLARTEQLKKDVTLEITASYFSQKQGRRVRVRAPVKKKVLGSPSKGSPAKNIYTKSDCHCRVFCAWPKEVNLYKRQMVDSAEKEKKRVRHRSHWVPFRTAGPR